MMHKDMILIGKIVGVHGVKGNLKIHSYAESPDLFQPDLPLYLADEAGAKQPVVLRWAKVHNRHVLLALDRVDTRDAAELLLGRELFVPKAALPVLEEDTFYWFDLVGLQVVTVEGVLLGTLKKIMPTAGHDVYVVDGEAGEILIPAIAAVIQQVDLASGKMRVILPA